MKILNFLKSTWSNFLIILIPILYTIDLTRDLLLNNQYSKIISFISIILIIISIIDSSRNVIKNNELLKENESLSEENIILKSNQESIPENMVKNLFKHLHLSSDDRITLYRIENDEWFIPVGRYSDNPFIKKGGREKYPIDEGFIGHTWAQGELKVNNLPNYETKDDEYIRVVQKKCNLNEGTIKNLTMKSRSFYCKRLEFNHSMPLAIIVFESTKPSLKVDENELVNFLKGPFGLALVEAIYINLPPEGKEL